MAKIKRDTTRRLVECELFKLIHHKWIIILSLFPTFPVVIAFAYMMVNYQEFTLQGVIEYPYNPFSKVSYILFKANQFTFPFIVTLLAAQYFLIEKQGKGGKLFHTVPYTPCACLAIRFVVLLLIIFTSILLTYVVFLCGIGICKVCYPLLSFDKYDMRWASGIFFSRLFFAACCISLIQYGLHLLTNNWYIPPILAFGAIMFGVMPEQYSHIDYYFAGGYLMSITNELSSGGTDYQWSYVVIMLIVPVLITLCCFIIRKKLKHCEYGRM